MLCVDPSPYSSRHFFSRTWAEIDSDRPSLIQVHGNHPICPPDAEEFSAGDSKYLKLKSPIIPKNSRPMKTCKVHGCYIIWFNPNCADAGKLPTMASEERNFALPFRISSENKSESTSLALFCGLSCPSMFFNRSCAGCASKMFSC